MNPTIQTYNDSQAICDQEICNLLARIICENLPEVENKIWHAHPVWFLDGNPIVGYSKRKNCVRLLFWSGKSFDKEILDNVGKFKATQLDFTSVDQIGIDDLTRLLAKSIIIQWDYKNIVKRKRCARKDKIKL